MYAYIQCTNTYTGISYFNDGYAVKLLHAKSYLSSQLDLEGFIVSVCDDITGIGSHSGIRGGSC